MIERVNTTTKTLERPDLREDTSSTTDDGTPKFFHYVKKDQIVDSAIPGEKTSKARLSGVPGLRADL